MRKTLSILGLAALLASGLAAAVVDPGVAPDDAIRMLSEGNERFARNLVLHPHQDAERLRRLAHREQPFAAVVADSDSRSCPEIVFDQGLGDLYVIRDGGAVVKSEVELGSLEYAVDKLGVNLIVVLGQTESGPLMEALRGVKKHPRNHLEELTTDLRAPVEEAGDKVGGLSGGDLMREATEMNVLYQMKEMLKDSPLIAERVKAGTLKVVGGVYHLENNRVQWLGEHPDQAAILAGKRP